MNEKYRQNFIQAGRLAGQVRAYGKSLIIKGASYQDVIAKINQKILELGAEPAFPPQMALNHVAAHFLPSSTEEIIFSDQIVKLDVGVCYEGAIGDCAVTVDLSGKNQPLIEAAEAALLAAEKIITVGLPIREIGRVIEETILSRGFRPIRNLGGHGLGEFRVHQSPSIPNYDDHSSWRIKTGMTFAIEPFATDGKGIVHEEGVARIFSYQKPVGATSSLARTLLEKIKTFRGLPFGFDRLKQEGVSILEIEHATSELVKLGALASYPPLVEVQRGMVAQAENSILVDKAGNVIVTTRV